MPRTNRDLASGRIETDVSERGSGVVPRSLDPELAQPVVVPPNSERLLTPGSSPAEWHETLTAFAVAAGADPARARERMAQAAQILVASAESERAFECLEAWLAERRDRSVTIRGSASGWIGVTSRGGVPGRALERRSIAAILGALVDELDLNEPR